MDAAIKRPETDNWLLLTACLRGPNLARGEAALWTLLDSLRQTPPPPTD